MNNVKIENVHSRKYSKNLLLSRVLYDYNVNITLEENFKKGEEDYKTSIEIIYNNNMYKK